MNQKCSGSREKYVKNKKNLESRPSRSVKEKTFQIQKDCQKLRVVSHIILKKRSLLN